MLQSPQVADTAPDEPFLTGYDMAHLVKYLRLLDADAEGADWREVAAIVLELDVAKDPTRTRRRRAWRRCDGRYFFVSRAIHTRPASVRQTLCDPSSLASSHPRRTDLSQLPRPRPR